MTPDPQQRVHAPNPAWKVVDTGSSYAIRRERSDGNGFEFMRTPDGAIRRFRKAERADHVAARANGEKRR